jgi:hypothetical protein
MDIDHLRALYPTLTIEELKEAEERLRRYFACAMQIANDSQNVPVDKHEHLVTIRERSNSKINNIPFEHG